ncbi:MAG: hypothetical protein LC713_00915 [Actinobacteria bacterium]|nr:hypothetical protein [Actinomycetota bacterium]
MPTAIQPPPVTRSPAAVQLMDTSQVMPALAEPTATSAAPATTKCKALTTSTPALVVCSLITSRPPVSATTWLGAPDTATFWALTTRAATWELPLVAAVDPEQVARARAMTELARSR